MERILGKFTPQIFAILRIAAGLMFMMHGSQKLFGWPGGGHPMALVSLMGLAGIIEFGGGALIALGLFAGTAAFIASGEMAAAYFMVHSPGGTFPIVNKGELAVLYCFLWLYVAAHGAGVWSVDAAMRRRRRTT